MDLLGGSEVLHAPAFLLPSSAPARRNALPHMLLPASPPASGSPPQGGRSSAEALAATWPTMAKWIGLAFGARAGQRRLRQTSLARRAARLGAAAASALHWSGWSSSFHGRPRPEVARCASAGDDEEADAEAALAALEAELEALEDGIAEEVEEQEARLAGKVDGLLSRAPAARASSVTPSKGPAVLEAVGRIAVCGFTGGKGPAKLLLERVASLGGSEPVWIDLKEVTRCKFEEVDDMMAGCTTAAICSDTSDDSPETLEALREGLRAILASAPDTLTKVVLVSRIGAQESKGGFNLGSFFGEKGTAAWDAVEDELTSNARKRTGNRQLHIVIIRTGKPLEAGAGPTQVQCLPAEGVGEGCTSEKTVAEAVCQALAFSVNSNFSVVDEPTSGMGSAPIWSELLLPFVGPEVYRTEVPDAKKAIFFVQGWAEEFFGEGKSAMRMGVKTPVLLQNTPSGVMFKFRPLGTMSEVDFNELSEGGVEFVVEEPGDSPARIRAKRCSYGWKVSVKENSERALLEKFSRDLAEVSA